MNSYYDIYTYTDALKSLGEFFTQLAAKESRIAIYGWREICEAENFKSILSTLETFESASYKFLRAANSMNIALASNSQRILHDGNLLSDLSIVFTALKIESTKSQSLEARAERILNIINIVRARLFWPATPLFGTISIKKLISSIHRLQQVSEMIGSEFIFKDDNNLFAPSRINSDIVIEHLNLAIDALKISNIALEHKNIIINQITITKQDIADEKTPWKKIIGSLLIISALLSGLADAPQACANITNAISYIMKSSISMPYYPAISNDSGDSAKNQSFQLPQIKTD
jgi:hypothetical protein